VAELFENIEVNREPRWPRLLRWIGGSVVLHAAILAAIFFVPQVRETLSLANAFSGAGYVDEDYQRTRIEDRAILLSLKDGKFTYPPGYFNDLTPGGVTEVVKAPEPPKTPEAKIISEYKEEKEQAEKEKREAKTTPSPIPSPSPAVPVPSLTVPSSVNTATGAVADAQSNDNKADLEQKLNETANSGGVERPDEAKINKRPLKEWLTYADELRKSGQLNLDGKVEIVIEADRSPTGKLEHVNIVKKDGDPGLIDVAKRLAQAISDSNVLYFMQDTKHLRLTMRLDGIKVSAKAEADAGSEDRAGTLAKTYGSLLYFGSLAKKGQTEATIYQAAKVKSEGKQVVVDFDMSRDTATGILKKYAPASQPAT
jgi:hypothetical protein